MIVLLIGMCVLFFVFGFALACFTEGTSRGALEHDLFMLEIENERLKRSHR